MTAATQVRLALRPEGEPGDDAFAVTHDDVPDPQDGQLLLRVVYLSLDPYMRGRMSAAESYADPLEIGEVMLGGTVCEVVASRHPDWADGDLVLSFSGWQSLALSDGTGLRRLDPSTGPLSTALGVLGMPGFTAYAGLLEIGRPQPGETVVVAAATGPVGSAVGQIARIKGARAVGIAGGPDKCRALIDDFGFDAALDHRSATFADDLAAAVPDGIDVYFENVGGQVAREVFRHVNLYARVPVCGLVATYNATGAPEGPDRLPGFLGLVLRKSLQVRGFIQGEFTASHGRDFVRDMSGWLADGSVRYREDLVQGLEGGGPRRSAGCSPGATSARSWSRSDPTPPADPTADPSPLRRFGRRVVAFATARPRGPIGIGCRPPGRRHARGRDGARRSTTVRRHGVVPTTCPAHGRREVAARHATPSERHGIVTRAPTRHERSDTPPEPPNR